MEFFKKIFCRRKKFKPQPKQLRIDGVKTTLTPKPDDAELAAQALLESRIYGDKAAIKRAQRHASMIYAEREQARRDSGKTQRKAAKKQKTSDLRPQTSDLRPQTSDLRLQTSDLRPQTSDFRPQTSDQPHDAAYYQQLSEKIRTAHEQERRMAMRYVAYCEEELKHQPSDISHITSLERGLYQHQDTVEREGGELLRRWQHCLAECIVRQMSTTTDDTD